MSVVARISEYLRHWAEYNGQYAALRTAVDLGVYVEVDGALTVPSSLVVRPVFNDTIKQTKL